MLDVCVFSIGAPVTVTVSLTSPTDIAVSSCTVWLTESVMPLWSTVFMPDIVNETE
jgi:hypothetical protein